MKIGDAGVARIAQLARLDLSEDELVAEQRGLNAILDYVAKLDELDTSDVEPTAHVLDMTQPFRGDEPTPPLKREEALQNAPMHDDQSFVVPRVI